jgi:large conductance mechanosensitive channel
MWKEFKEFIMRGNALDLAIGIIIGAAFGAIVNSLVKDIIMPPIGLALGRVDFTNLFWTISSGETNPGPYATLSDAQAAGAVTFNYGVFINTLVSFIIIAFAVFLVVKGINHLRRATEKKKEAVPTTKDCPYCASTIPIKATRCPNCTSQLKTAKA